MPRYVEQALGAFTDVQHIGVIVYFRRFTVWIPRCVFFLLISFRLVVYI